MKRVCRPLSCELAVAATYLPLVILGLFGAVRTLRRGWPYLLCWFPAVYFTALHVVFVGFDSLSPAGDAGPDGAGGGRGDGMEGGSVPEA